MADTRRAVWITDQGHAVDGLWRPNPGGFEHLTLAALFTAIMRIVCGYGVAVLGPDVCRRYGLPSGQLPTTAADFKNHGCAVELRSHGFKVKQIDRWFHVEHPDIAGPGVWFALAEFIDLDYCPMFDGNRKLVTAGLAEWHRITGSVWRGAAGAAGNALLRQQRYGHHKAEPQWWGNGAMDGPYGDPENLPYELAYDRHSWRSTFFDEPPATLWGLDRIRAYLSAMTTTKVAGAHLKHDRLTSYRPGRCGWYAVQRGRWEFGRVLPDPAGYHPTLVDPQQPDGPVWLAHPTVALLDELARDGFASYRVLDSWTAPATDVLINHGKRLRDVWAATAGIGDPAVRALVRKAVKGVYKQSHGFWCSTQSEVKRRDWAGALVAQSRANLHRRLWQLWRGDAKRPEALWFDGPTPMFIETDDVYFPEPLRPEGWTIWDGDRDDLDDVTGLGHWRTSKTIHRVSRETQEVAA